MEAVFLKVLNMSLIAGCFILAVMLLRIVFKKAPKSLRCALWALVAIRLICPFSFESNMSFMSSEELISQDYIDDEENGIELLGKDSKLVITDSISQSSVELPIPSDVEAIENPEGSEISIKATTFISMQQITHIVTIIWIAGMVLMLIYCVVSYVRVRRKVTVSMRLHDNIYICDDIEAPFVLGIIKPRIYLPSDMTDKEQTCVIAHEQAHLKRHDNWWKPLGFILLSVYWFNPLIWVAYILLCRDIELACDERVIKNMDASEKKRYSEVLLACSVSHKMIMATPLAFGEVAVKSRVKSVLNYRKPAFWIIIIALMASVALMVGFMTKPVSYERTIDEELDAFVSNEILEHFKNEYTADNFACENHKILGVETDNNRTVIYTWVLYEEYKYEHGILEEETGSHIPTVITVSSNENGEYYVQEYWEPRDGSYYADDVRSKFPRSIEDEAIDSQLYVKEQSEACELLAKEHFGIEDNNEPAIEQETTSVELGNSIEEENNIISYRSLDNMYCIELNTDDNTCYFFCPWLSVSQYSGSYELTDDKLVLTFEISSTSEVTRVFSRNGDKLTYNIFASKNPEQVNMMLDNGEIFVLDGSNILEDEIDKIIGEGIMGHKEQYLVFTPEDLDTDNIHMRPLISLDQLKKTFTYTDSPLSSYMVFGEYEYTEDKLILRAYDASGGETYVFVRQGDRLVYSNELSTISYESTVSSSITSNLIIGQVYVLQEEY